MTFEAKPYRIFKGEEAVNAAAAHLLKAGVEFSVTPQLGGKFRFDVNVKDLAHLPNRDWNDASEEDILDLARREHGYEPIGKVYIPDDAAIQHITAGGAWVNALAWVDFKVDWS